MTLVERLRYWFTTEPMALEAADHIEQLEAQVETLSVDWSVMVSRCEKLEAALRDVADLIEPLTETSFNAVEALRIARRALEEER